MEFSIPPIMWLLAFQLTLYACAWGVCSLLLRESRVAVAHWGIFLLLVGIGLALVGARDDSRQWLAFNGANLLVLTGFAAMRRGTERFMAAPNSDREQLLVLLPLLALTALFGPDKDHAVTRVTLAYAVEAYVVLRTMWTIRLPLKREFGRPAVLVILVPGLLIGLTFAAAALRQMLNWQQPLELQRNLVGNLGLVAIFLAGSALFNVGFMAMLMMRLVVNLRQASQIDPLTGLFNRRALDQALELAWQGHLRTRQPLSLLMVDVDHFKRVNDTHGHAAGDQVLVHLAALLQRNLRVVDVVGRLGGEEFLLLLPGSDESQATVLAERLRQQVMASVPKANASTTVSIGIAQAQPSDISVQMLVARADKALYRAKSLGRNRVERAERAERAEQADLPPQPKPA